MVFNDAIVCAKETRIDQLIRDCTFNFLFSFFFLAHQANNDIRNERH